jgi:hypothetical protein
LFGALALAACGDDATRAGERSDRLATLPIAAGSVTTSGTRGSYMAVQFHSRIRPGDGVGVDAGYYCARIRCVMRWVAA